MDSKIKRLTLVGVLSVLLLVFLVVIMANGDQWVVKRQETPKTESSSCARGQPRRRIHGTERGISPPTG